MMKDNANNQNALRVQRILDGEIRCSTYNLRMCYFDASVKEHDSLEACLKEMEEKLSPEVKADSFMQECMQEFKEKIAIYDRFFRELSRREIEGIEYEPKRGSSAMSCRDGNLVSDDGKPKDGVSDTVGNMAAGEPC